MDMFARNAGLVAPNLADKHVAVVGVGAGSRIAVELARLGVGNLTIIDHDLVDWSNLTRSAYEADHVGRPKVDCLKALIARAVPSAHVIAVAAPAQEALAVGWPSGRPPDLLVAGTDSAEAQRFLSRLALSGGIDAVHVEAYVRGHGGQVLLVEPGKSPCLRCVCKLRYEALAAGKSRSSAGLPALGIQIGFVDHIALTIVAAVLSRGTDSDAGRFLHAIGDRRQVVVRCHPGFRFGDADIFNTVYSDLPMSPKDYAAELKDLHVALDTLWLRPRFDPDCPDCKLVRHG